MRNQHLDVRLAAVLLGQQQLVPAAVVQDRVEDVGEDIGPPLIERPIVARGAGCTGQPGQRFPDRGEILDRRVDLQPTHPVHIAPPTDAPSGPGLSVTPVGTVRIQPDHLPAHRPPDRLPRSAPHRRQHLVLDLRSQLQVGDDGSRTDHHGSDLTGDPPGPQRIQSSGQLRRQGERRREHRPGGRFRHPQRQRHLAREELLVRRVLPRELRGVGELLTLEGADQPVPDRHRIQPQLRAKRPRSRRQSGAERRIADLRTIFQQTREFCAGSMIGQVPDPVRPVPPIDQDLGITHPARRSPAQAIRRRCIGLRSIRHAELATHPLGAPRTSGHHQFRPHRAGRRRDAIARTTRASRPGHRTEPCRGGPIPHRSAVPGQQHPTRHGRRRPAPSQQRHALPERHP